jgi:hypothetical protein
MQFVVVGVDVVRDEDNDAGNKDMVDEDVEGKTGGDQAGSCWTPRLS